MKLTVVHLEGSKQGLTETFSGQVITIGRDPSNTLSFDPFKDLDVSTRHASLTVQGQEVLIQDLGSTNGTYLNGEKLTGGAVSIPAGGCMVKFGENGPKVQLSWTLDTGPGKKTVMIHELRSELDSAGEEARKAKARTTKMVGCVVLLAILGAGIAWIVSSMNAKEQLTADVAKLSEKATKQRSFADLVSAQDQAESKDAYAAAVAALEEAKAAEEAGDMETAKAKFGEATEGFDEASKKAGLANQKALRAEQKASKAAQEAREKEQRAKESREADAVAKLKAELAAEQEKKLKALEDKLKAARDTAGLTAELEGLEDSKNPDELKSGIAAAEKALAGLDKDSPEAKALQARLDKMKGTLEEVKDLSPESLKKIAKKARPMVVVVRSRVFGVPRGQTLRTTKLRYPVAEGSGTGFVVSKAGHVVTAKEVVKPELFDLKALARHAKLKGKGMTFHRELDILSYSSTAKVYSSVLTDTVKVVIAREFPDSLGGTTKVKIDFQNQTSEVEVKPHLRDDADLVVLKIEGLKGDQPFLPLAPGESEAGLPVINLGVQVDKKDKQLALFYFDGRVKTAGKVMDLGAPSFSNWIGGPVLDPGGRVVGVVVHAGVETSKAVSASTLRPVVGGK